MVLRRSQTFDQTKISVLHEGAKVIANYLSRLPGTKAVGLFGSLARGKATPRDIDLVVFNNRLYKSLPSKIQHGYSIHLEHGLPESMEMPEVDKLSLLFFVERYAYQRVTFDLVVLPENLTPDVIQKVSRENPDQLFLRNLSRDILFWNPDQQSFVKNELFRMRFFPQSIRVAGMEIKLVSGHCAGEGSLVVVKDGGQTIALDCGASPTNGDTHYAQRQRVVQALCYDYPPDFLVISHFHYDHFGSIVEVLKELKKRGKRWPTIISSLLTFLLLRKWLERNGLKEDFGWSWKQKYRLRHQLATDKIKLIGVSHSVPESAGVLFLGNKKVLYTGDFFRMNLDPEALNPDLMIVDTTCALANQIYDKSKEQRARLRIARLTQEALEISGTKVFIALFSTQLERASWLYDHFSQSEIPIMIAGPSLFHNLRVYRKHHWLKFWSKNRYYRVALVTGAWAQGEGTNEKSALVRLSEGNHGFTELQPGDLVILSCRIPTWSPTLMNDISKMCQRLRGLDVEVIVDESAPPQWEAFASRELVHAGGHGHLPDILDAIRRVKPKKVLPFHASPEARNHLAEICGRNGYEIETGRSTIFL